MNRCYFFVRCEEIRENLTYIFCKLSCNAILHGENVLLVSSCGEFLNQ